MSSIKDGKRERERKKKKNIKKERKENKCY